MSQSTSQVPATLDTHTASALERIKSWWTSARAHWQRLDELAALAPADLERIAADLGVGPLELREAAARPASASALLVRRLQALGVSESDADALSPMLLASLHRTCAACADKAVCSRDLDHDPAADEWHAYCPNAADLTGLSSHETVTSVRKPRT